MLPFDEGLIVEHYGEPLFAIDAKMTIDQSYIARCRQGWNLLAEGADDVFLPARTG